MAIYTYRCGRCGWTTEVVQSIKSYCISPNVPVCVHCPEVALPMERYLTKPLVTFDTQPWDSYRSPIDGTPITSRKERNEHMARHGVVMLDDIKPDIERNRKRIEHERVASIKSDVVDALHKVEAGHKPVILDESQLVPGA